MWANIIPSYISSLETSFAPASIIATRSLVEATVTYISLLALCSRVGLITYSPSTRPTTTPEIGPSQGISEIEIAIETPSMAVISGWQSGSTDITVATTPTSFLISLGKSGLMGLSITLEARVAFSLALPSRRWNEPGILPTE